MFAAYVDKKRELQPTLLFKAAKETTLLSVTGYRRQMQKHQDTDAWEELH